MYKYINACIFVLAFRTPRTAGGDGAPRPERVFAAASTLRTHGKRLALSPYSRNSFWVKLSCSPRTLGGLLYRHHDGNKPEEGVRNNMKFKDQILVKKNVMGRK